MTNHIPEHRLEALYLSPEEISEQEKSSIEQHLSQCTLCREHSLKLKEFYRNLQENLSSPPTERDRVFAEKLLAQKRLALPLKAIVKKNEEALDAYAEVIEPYYRSLPQRIIRYVQIHPVQATVRFSLAAALAAALFFVVKPVKDTNPVVAKVLNSILSAYNKEGDLLWKKSALGLPDYASDLTIANAHVNRQFLYLADIDADERQEVMLFGYFPDGTFAVDTMYCFDHDGKLRWQAGCGRIERFGKMDFTAYAQWGINTVFTITNPTQAKRQIFVVAQALPYFPGKVFELSPDDGRELQTYWNTGGLDQVLPFDVDHDGKQEIVLGGINNAYRRACVVVLDPAHFDGCGPSTPDFFPEGFNKGIEKYYLLLPWTDLGQTVSPTVYNQVLRLSRIDANMFRVTTKESQNEKYGGEIIYNFGQRMQIQSVVASDPFISSHERLERQGKLTEKLDSAYYQELEDSVQYWDGERFVSEPTENRYYTGIQPKP